MTAIGVKPGPDGADWQRFTVPSLLIWFIVSASPFVPISWFKDFEE